MFYLKNGTFHLPLAMEHVFHCGLPGVTLHVQYDFIAHTDTLVEDLRLFFHRSGIVGKDGILPRQHPSRAKARFGRTFRVVPPEDIRRLGEIYKPDFDMFGYSIEEDLEMIENEQKQNV
ncbi:hypothetical protein Bbelb_239550 [Branchiostoma belcheri]|nr:hypothetical protein Bbelb_239550 [Branchiostoma belcheri]